MRLRRLFWLIYPAQVLVVAVALGAVAHFTVHTVESFHLRRTASDLEARAALAMDRIAALDAPRDPARVDAVCDRMGRRTQTRYTVVRPSGIVIGDSEEDPAAMENHADRPEIRSALQRRTGRSTRYSATLECRMMYVAVPFIADGDRLQGVVRASMPLSDIEAAGAALRQRVWLAFGSVLLMAAGVSLFLSRRIARPIADMRDAASELSKRRFDLRLPSPHCREMQGLADAVNRLASDLHARITELTTERNQRNAMFASMREAVLALDARGRLVFANRAAGTILGVDTGDSLGRHLSELIRNEELFFLVDAAERSDESAQGDIPLRDARQSVLRAHATALVDADGARSGTLLVLDDVTETRRLQQVRRDFVTNVSHELKTPITSIAGFADTLLDGAVKDPADTERFLKIIAKQARNLTAVIDDLFTLASLEAPGQQRALRLEEQTALSVLRRAVEVCEPDAQAKGIAIRIRCPADLRARMHPGLIEQAVVNLLRNAIEYSEEGGSVEIDAQRRDGELRISVQDHGCGIPAHHRQRVFERFYRVDKGRSRRAGGTGLGLAIVKHITAVHGGRAEIASRTGEGTTVSLVLPAP